MRKQLYFLCVVLLLGMLTGCRSSNEKAVREVINSAFQAYQTRNLNDMKKYTGASFQTSDIPFFKNNDQLVDPVIKSLSEKTSISIQKVTISGDQATVIGKVNISDIGAIIRKVELAIRNREITANKTDQLAVFTNAVNEEVKSNDAPMREYDVEVKLQKVEGTWEIILDEKIRDAMTGGFITYIGKE